MSESRPRWSVVVPVYNKAPYIEATLRSVLAQTDADFEIVVVDDGSRDESVAVVEAIVDPRIRLHRQANAGVSAARNRGVRESRGEFVVFLDGDDLHHPECLARFDALRRALPQADTLAGGFQRVEHERMDGHRFAALPAPDAELIDNMPARFLKVGMPFFTSSIAVRRALLDRIAPWFPEGEAMGEDIDLWFRLGEAGPIAYTRAPLAVYRIGMADSLMGSYKGTQLLAVWQRMEARALDGTMPAAQRADALRVVAEMRVTIARRQLRQGQWQTAWSELRSAWRGMRGRRWWLTATVACLHSRKLAGRLR